MTDRSGKTYVITGGVSGLGLATAKLLYGQGANVSLLDLNKELGDKVMAESFDPSRALFTATNVIMEEEMEAAFDATMKKFGTVNGVINSAGLGSATVTFGKKGVHPNSIWDFIMKVNLYGTFYGCTYGAKAMSESGHNDGVIVNVSSVAGIEGQKGQVAYSASKGAVIGMTLPMARDLSRYGIRVMTIAPGIMETPLMMMAPDQIRDGLMKGVAGPKRFGQAEEFALLVATIIDNGYLNGEVIRLDGGMRFPNL